MRRIISHMHLLTGQVAGREHIAVAVVSEARAIRLPVQEDIRKLRRIAVPGIEHVERDLRVCRSGARCVAALLPADPFPVERIYLRIDPGAVRLLQAQCQAKALIPGRGVRNAPAVRPASDNKYIAGVTGYVIILHKTHLCFIRPSFDLNVIALQCFRESTIVGCGKYTRRGCGQIVHAAVPVRGKRTGTAGIKCSKEYRCFVIRKSPPGIIGVRR